MSNIIPLAIVSYACRFPGGVDSPQSYWELLIEGRDAITEIPADRWDQRHFLGKPEDAGKSYTFRAGTLGDISGFDAAFFGISPREAEQIDPQQRLLLELTWEALERGGQISETLSDKECAVYVGISTTDYSDIRQGDPAGGNAYFMLGSSLSIAANRISYVFDLHGPSMAVDTACSSALVALYEAVHAVRDGRARMAVVGAVNLLLSPLPFVGFSKASMLSPYGLCRAFDKVAKGYVRAEGGGVLLLKPLADAERDGDPILAVIRDVGVNTNGRTQGIALPSAERQEELLRRVYKECGADPANLVYLEAHGTGTEVGDPIEAGAIGRALALQRPKDLPLPIGSAKTNLGHMEPASGMAGVIKAIHILRHRVIPPTLHVDAPNPDIDFAGLNLHVATAAMPLPTTKGKALVGVNSFGFGGANAHVVIEEYCGSEAGETAVAALPAELTGPLLLTARAEAALAQYAGRLADALEGKDAPSLSDAAWTLARRRSHHTHRVALRGASRGALLANLRAFAEGRSSGATLRGKTLSSSPRVAFLYSGNGAQWLGMGVRLLAEDASFRTEVERIDALVRQRAGWSVIEELHAPADQSRIFDTRFSQPLLFAVQAGITSGLAARGLKPEAVTGHSVGEVAAAYAAGVLDLESAVEVILHRSAVQGKTRGMGRMAAVAFSPERAQEAIADFAGKVELAAFNSPSAVTLSGSEDALLALKDRCAADGTDFRLLDLDYAFHSRVLEPFQQELLGSLAGVTPTAGNLRVYSTVEGGLIDGSVMDGMYWWRNVRQPVCFRQAVERMVSDGFSILVEIGPHPIMQSYIRQSVHGVDVAAQPVGTVNRQNPGAERLDRAADEAWTLGAELDWAVVYPGTGRCVDLPSYPWQRERHWFPITPEARGLLFSRWEGPLLGARPAAGAPLWEATLDPQTIHFLTDHQVGGAIVFPAAGFAEMALEASRVLFGQDRHEIEQLEIRRPLVLDRTKVVRFSWNPDQAVFHIASRTYMTDDAWSVHVTGRLTEVVGGNRSPVLGFTASAAARVVGSAEHYAFAESIGLVYGPAFQTVQSVTVDGDHAFVRLVPPPSGEFELHPATFDGCLQALFNILKDRLRKDDRPHAFLPSQFGRLLVHDTASAAVACHIALTKVSLRSIVADFVLVDAGGNVVAEAHACRFQRMELGRAHQQPARYEFETVPLLAPRRERLEAVIPSPSPAPADVLTPVAAAFAAEALAAAGSRVSTVRPELLEVVSDLARVANPAATADDLWRCAIAENPERLAELTMLGRVGLHLGAILAGGDAGAAFASASTLDHFADAAPAFTQSHDALVASVAAMARGWPSHKRLRVVEVGAFSAGLTMRLLAALPADQFDYTVAVTDPDAIPAVEASLGSLPGRSVMFIDPEVPVPEQAALIGVGFDLVIAASCLGAWRDTVTALNALVSLGNDGAVVVASAPVRAGWLDLLQGVYVAAGKPFVPRSQPDLENAATAAGLRSIRVVGIGSAQVLTATVSARADSRPLPEPKAPWLILAGASGPEAKLAVSLAEHLGAGFVVHPTGELGQDEAVSLDVGEPGAWRDLLATFKEADSEPAGVIHLLGAFDHADGGEAQMALQERRCWPALAFAQGLSGAGLAQPPNLVVVTSGLAGGAPHQAPLWGVGRVLRNEFPQLSVRHVDLAGEDPSALAEVLAAEILQPCGEDEVVLGADRRLGFRLRRRNDAKAIEGEGETLSFMSGSLDNLAWVPASRRAPGRGEVEVEVRASGLNFRDVMLAQGVLPDEAVENGFAGATVGMEAAGIILRTGEDVGDLLPGDQVLFFAPACFSSHVTMPVTALARKPARLNFHSAATIPTTFFTIYYALNELARLRKGERVLIHGAAGGVGLAAIQYCRHIGAEIFATAGTPEKRDIVRLAGVAPDHIFDSRSLEFADEVRRMTGGEGVDVVLNSLAGEAIHRSILTLRPFGRFLELGKRDFFANTPLGLRPFRNNISYFGIDADQLMALRPELAARLFGEMMGLFEQGVFSPLPYRVFPRDRVVEAFRHMQQSRHIGKIVIDGPTERTEAVARSETAALILDPEACYLVTGGLGGFGLSTARWLADKGARTLVLASRRGASTEEARKAVAELEARGVNVVAASCDVTDAAQVRALVASCPKPIKGVVHAAAVFDDGIALNMSRQQFSSVVAPKLVGGWALHEATQGLPLDFFVLYSSVTTILGNPGQANYVAGNLYLEALARYRRNLGLPALAVGWGAIADAGYLTRNAEIRDSLATRMGVEALTTEKALARLESLLVGDCPAVTVIADIDWRTLGATLPSLKSPRFAEVTVASSAEAAANGVDLSALLAGLSPPEVREVLVELVAEQVASVLRLPADRLETDRSIFDMGMDSLMALELRMAIEERFGVELPVMAMSEGASIARLAERIGDHLLGNTGGQGERSEVSAVLSKHAVGLDEAAIAAEVDTMMQGMARDRAMA